jgi:hypothetical protein
VIQRRGTTITTTSTQAATGREATIIIRPIVIDYSWCGPYPAVCVSFYSLRHTRGAVDQEWEEKEPEQKPTTEI